MKKGFTGIAASLAVISLTVTSVVYAQEGSPTDSPTPTTTEIISPLPTDSVPPTEASTPTPTETPLAHLTFRTCLIPNTTSFRLSFRADYRAGEYRVVGENSGFTLNLGYLEVNEEGGGFSDSNTQYVLPFEDTWKKQWFNGERWQRSGGLPVTSVQDHIERDALCEQGERTPYERTPYTTTTPTPTSVPSGGGSTNKVNQVNESTNTTLTSSTSAPAQTSTPTPPPQPIAAVHPTPTPGVQAQGGQVLGTSSVLADTGAEQLPFIAVPLLGMVGSTLAAVKKKVWR